MSLPVNTYEQVNIYSDTKVMLIAVHYNLEVDASGLSRWFTTVFNS